MESREAIEKEVVRLQGRCLTEEGKVGIVVDYIIRLLNQKDTEREMGEDKPTITVLELMDVLEKQYDDASWMWPELRSWLEKTQQSK